MKNNLLNYVKKNQKLENFIEQNNKFTFTNGNIFCTLCLKTIECSNTRGLDFLTKHIKTKKYVGPLKIRQGQTTLKLLHIESQTKRNLI